MGVVVWGKAVGAGWRRGARPARELVLGAVEQARGRSTNEHLGEHARDLARLAVFHPVNMNAGSRAIRMIEPLDPGRGRAQQRRFFADHEDGVEAADRSKIDDILAETVV